MKKFIPLVLFALPLSASAQTLLWDGESFAPTTLPYTVTTQAPANNCEFYVDNFQEVVFNGTPVNFDDYEARLKLNPGLETTPSATTTYAGFIAGGNEYINPMPGGSPGGSFTVHLSKLAPQFTVFIDVSTAVGITRETISVRNQGPAYDATVLLGPGATIFQAQRGAVSIANVQEPSAIYDQRHACQWNY